MRAFRRWLRRFLYFDGWGGKRMYPLHHIARRVRTRWFRRWIVLRLRREIHYLVLRWKWRHVRIGFSGFKPASENAKITGQILYSHPLRVYKNGIGETSLVIVHEGNKTEIAEGR
jgi:hypothetical protein